MHKPYSSLSPQTYLIQLFLSRKKSEIHSLALNQKEELAKRHYRQHVWETAAPTPPHTLSAILSPLLLEVKVGLQCC